jgi:hypothetical protein
MDGTWIAWTSAVVSAVSGCGAVAALVVTVSEGRAARRNTEFLAHRDQWWNRWTWIAERAVSDDAGLRAVAAVMALAIETRPWTTRDDHWVFRALRDHLDDGRNPDDLEDV